MSALSHVTFVVRDLERMSKILSKALKARCVHTGFEERFFLLGDVWIAILKGAPDIKRSYNHIAFKIDVQELEERRQAIKALGLEMAPARPRGEGEGQSLYFYDDDNHLFELHTGTLEERLGALAKD